MPRIHVYDTYATNRNGRILHFDVVLAEKDETQALACARDWLQSIGEDGAVVSQERCCYCHSEDHVPPEMECELAGRGYAIYRMEGCPPAATS